MAQSVGAMNVYRELVKEALRQFPDSRPRDPDAIDVEFRVVDEDPKQLPEEKS
jgi:hypothetical protein